ncbi:MAG: DUF4272 domain-containing protein [Erysipelotrichaceae bacterium]|nr:DUF4272 domain-containing protein [Erysipelotrichaceae bacterium]
MGMVTETLSFYTPYADTMRMEQALSLVLREGLISLRKDDRCFYVELRDQEYLTIPFLSAQTNPSLLQKQIQILYASSARMPAKDPYIKQNLLYQIALFRAAYVFTFQYEKQERNDKILPLMEIADHMDALIFWESGDISDSYGDVILNKRGHSEMTVFNPVDGFDIANQALGLHEKQLRRMHHSLSVLRYKGIYAPTNIAPPYDDKLVVLQDEEAVCQRAIACMLVGVYTEVLIDTRGDYLQAYKNMEQLLDLYKASSYFTVREIEYLHNDVPSAADVHHYTHYFEYAYVLLWMVGLFETLYFPSAFCDRDAVMKVILNFHSIAKLVRKARLRKMDELLGALDLVQRYSWACRDAQKLGFLMPQGLCQEAVVIRHHALNWVVGAQGVGFDEVVPVISSLKAAHR